MGGHALPLTRSWGQPCHHLTSDLSLNCVPRPSVPVGRPDTSDPIRQANDFTSTLTSLNRKRGFSKQRTSADDNCCRHQFCIENYPAVELVGAQVLRWTPAQTCAHTTSPPVAAHGR